MDAEVAMRELAANVLRIVRGAGAPYYLRRQMIALLTAMEAHWKADRTWPLQDMTRAVYMHDKPDYWDRLSAEAKAEWYAERQVLSGALRQLAGELVGPPVQASHGHSEMYGGINEIYRLREEEAKPWRSGAKSRPTKNQYPKRRAGKGKAAARAPKTSATES